MLKWPEKARKAVSVFFTRWNDIDVYVEDTAKHAKSVYISFVNNALAGNCKVENVFPLGGRDKVIETCKGDQAAGGRPRIYLVDGDLNLVVESKEEELHRFFSHKVYAVENYFFCESAIIEILHEENPHHSVEDIISIFDFPGFLEAIKPLNKLFIYFGVTKIINSELPTIGLGLGVFLNKKGNFIDGSKVDDFCIARENELLQVASAEEIKRQMKIVESNIKKFKFLFDVIAAREYLFPLLTMWRSNKGLKIVSSKEAMQMRLAKNADLTRHTDLLESLRKVAVS